MSNFESKNAARLKQLDQRLVDLNTEISELNRRRDALTLDYSQGHKGAIKETAQIDAAVDVARRELSLLTTAAVQTQQLMQDEQAAIVIKEDAKRQLAAAEAAAAVILANQQIDDLLVKLREACERRHNQLGKLAAALDDKTLVMRMLSKAVLTNALAHAGLTKFADVSVGLRSATPLSDSNRHLVSIAEAEAVTEAV